MIRPVSGCGTSLRPSSTRTSAPRSAAAASRAGTAARSIPTKIPDLIGVKDRKYIDHTGTHAHRNIGDLMRYAALVSFADDVDFAGHA